MATITCEPDSAWTCDPGPLRCPSCRSALRRTQAGFDCNAQACGASLPVRAGVLVVCDAPSDDNRIAADFYNSKLWPKTFIPYRSRSSVGSCWSRKASADFGLSRN